MSIARSAILYAWFILRYDLEDWLFCGGSLGRQWAKRLRMRITGRFRCCADGACVYHFFYSIPCALMAMVRG